MLGTFPLWNKRVPELPEVEVSRLGIEPVLSGQRIADVIVRTPALRLPIDPALPAILRGRRVTAVARRGKYLLVECRMETGPDASSGWLILHLGMSGSLRLVAPGAPLLPHDHVDLIVGDRALRFRDPRRFGVLLWHAGPDVLTHPLLARLGVEPLTDAFSGAWLHAVFRNRQAPVKPALMDAHLIVGIGNIYAAESLFRAGISPLRAAGRISADRCDRLAAAVKTTLNNAIAAGGSSVRDYIHSDGGAGCFQLQCAVYDRTDAPCPRCTRPIRQIRQAGRSTFYCPHCQR